MRPSLTPAFRKMKETSQKVPGNAGGLLAALALLLLLAAFPAAALAKNAKNIILMISDGAGFNIFNCANYYQYGRLGQQVYDGFPVKLAATTYMLNAGGIPQGYDPDLCWTDFNYVKGDNNYTSFTDSAAAGTAMHTGSKTLQGYVNIDALGARLTTIAEIADAAGKSCGSVSTTHFSHATPACVWAHSSARSDYVGIAAEMIYDSGLDVVISAGHPDYDNDGHPAAPNYEYVGQSTWNDIANGTTGCGWTLVETKADFEAIAANAALAPDRLIGIAQVHRTFQYERSGTGMGSLNGNVPDLATASKAALNALSKNPKGFYVMIEGAAIDFGGHDNNLARMIEEQIDFNRAVEAVVDWVNANSTWDETLLIVTADHETGQLWGPDAGLPANFDLPVNNGAGNLPTAAFCSGQHTNALVPIYSKGYGSEAFATQVDGTDPNAAAVWGIGGLYIDNTDIFTAMRDVCYAAGDIDRDADIDAGDLAVIAAGWLNSDCGPANDWCDGADIWEPNTVDMLDYAAFAADYYEVHSLDIRVSAANDDAEELNTTGNIDLASTDLELTDDTAWHGGLQTIGMRFNNIQLAGGATIEAAHVQFTVDELNDLNPCPLTIRAQAADNAPTFSAAYHDITNRPVTIAAVAWSPTAWTAIADAGPAQRTPDIASAIQEVINRPGWEKGNSIVVIITGSGRRVAEAFDGVPASAPLLHLEF